MKRIIVLLGSILLIIALSGQIKAQEEEQLTADEIIAKTDELMNSDYMEMLVEMKITKPGKEDKISEMKLYAQEDENVLIKILSPAREKGQGYLRIGDDLWMYLPSVEKSIRVAAKTKVLGGDFTGSDLMRFDLANDYTATLVGEEEIDGELCYVIELKATNRSVSYDMVKDWIRKEDFIQARMEFYTLSGKLLKIMTFSDIKEIGGRILPTTIMMQDMLRKENLTWIQIIEADYDAELSDNMFTRNYLERGM